MLLKNKKILISGLANKYSIAAGIASSMYREGAKLAFTYQNERMLKNLAPLAKKYGSDILIECDVASDESIKMSFIELNKHWDNFDGFVHSIGFAPADQLEGNFVDVTTREGFKIAHDISSYSFTAMAKEAKPFLNSGSALLTLTYLGAVQTLPNYNVMGLAKASLEANTRFLAASMGAENIRVNAISAGPIKTLAASGVKNFRKMLSMHSSRAPLGRTVTTEEVGNVAAFLCSDYASGVTGEITYVDAGFNTSAMPLFDIE
jgi:enoyl-[acyl-carrier protein] reductase I|tara:strand:+ start:1937 stop:2722 length:786 start_codon:yes stop_codon:yes gene_type:complete